MKTQKTIIIFTVMALLIFCHGCSDDGDSSNTDGDAEEADSINKPVPHGTNVLVEKTQELIDRLCPLNTTPSGSDEYDCRHSPELLDECVFHSDCSERENGYCDSVGGTPCKCRYHECFKDFDCAEGEACICYASRQHRICAKSCRSSNECEEGHKCVIAGLRLRGCTGNITSEMTLYGVEGFRCTSDEDECESDWDCPEYDRCVYTEEKGHFSCEYDKWLENCEGES